MDYLSPLQDGCTLAVFDNDSLVFSSKGRWLHPLFELEGFLKNYKGKRDNLSLHDTVQGRAAAALTLYLGITHVNVDLISNPALELYERNNVVDVTFREQIERILCCTEDLITPSMSINDIYRFLRKKANLTDGLKLEVKNLSFSYDDKKILDDVSFTLEKGDAYILTGDNGSGKSTLLSCILGLLKPEQGEILFDGKAELHDAAYVKQLQSVSPFPLSVEEVVRMAIGKGEKNKAEHVELALRRTGVYHLKDRNYFTLSGGEAQKVNLSRALASKARLLVLDEPTASLDSTSRDEILDLLSSLRFSEMPTILLVSHDDVMNTRLAWPRLHLKGGHLA